MLQNNPGVSGLGYPDKKKDYDFYFDYAGVHVEFSLKEGSDLFRLSTKLMYPGHSDAELGEICDGIKLPRSVRCSYHDENVIFMHTHPLAGKQDDIACGEIRESLQDFLNFLGENRDKFDVSLSVRIPDMPKGASLERSPLVAEASASIDSETPVFPLETVTSSVTELSVVTELPTAVSDFPAGVQEVSRGKPVQESQMFSEASPVIPELHTPPVTASAVSAELELRELQPEASSIVTQTSSVYEPSVADQMRKMYADMDQVFRSRKTQIEYREDTLDKRELVLEAREAEIECRQRELQQKFDQWDIREAEFKAREMQLDVRAETIAAGERALEDRQAHLDSIDQNDAVAFCRRITELEAECSQHRENIRRLEAQCTQEDRTEQDVGRWQHAYEAKEAEFRQLKKVVETEYQALETQLTQEHARVQKLEAAGSMEECLKESLKTLSSLGMSGHVRDGGIDAVHGNSKLRVLPDIHLLRIEHSVKKGVKYQRSAVNWNAEDEAVVFLVYEKKIECLAGFRSLEDTLGKLLPRLEALK